MSSVTKFAGGFIKASGKLLGLGGGGGGGGGKGPKKKKELGKLSLFELTSLREEETTLLTKQQASQEKKLAALEASLSTVSDFSRGGIERNILKSKEQIAGITTSLAGGEEGRLGEINIQIQKLTRQRLGTRTRRATAIST